MAIALKSPAFNPGGMIPPKHGYEGGNVSPAMEWSGLPPQAKALALVCDDPDAPAGTWVHWVLYDLSASSKGLAEGATKNAAALQGAKEGVNDYGEGGWGGPCPPSGTHRYVFTLYALDRPTGLAAGADKARLLRAMQGRILGSGELIGRFKKA